ncbi:MAG: hypothetical protein U0271_01485 [Polyangiaceae bacterium]
MPERRHEPPSPNATPDEAGLPVLHGRWLRELLGGPIPKERNASCEACPMCSADAAPTDARTAFFDASVKCCTWVPALPNFLAGSVLVDPNGAELGKRSVLDRLRARVGASPLGLAPPPKHDVLYRESVVLHPEGNVFGRARSLRCPHYEIDSGGCSIWAHRDGTCTTWFCKHVRGATGSRFWISVHGLLKEIERALSLWVLFELGLDARLVDQSFRRNALRLGAEDLDASVSDEAWAARWGAWVGREAELYEAAAHKIAGLAWGDVARIAGPELTLRAALARDAHAKLLSNELPTRLRPAKLRVLPMVEDSIRVETYSPYDAVDVSASILELAARFTSRPTSEVLAALQAEGIEDADELVRRLVDFALLEPIDR